MNLRKNFIILTSIFMLLGCNLALATSGQTPAVSGDVSGDTGAGSVVSGDVSGDIDNGSSGDISTGTSGDVSTGVSGDVSGDISGDLSGDLEKILNSVALDSTFTINKNAVLEGAMEATVSGDEAFAFDIVTLPTHGTVSQLTSGDAAFIYMPATDYIGSDLFTFRLVSGDYYSNIGTVSITIESSGDPVIPFYYEDMQNHWANYSASHLAARGYIIGEEIGDEFYYCPDRQMTRGDFLLFLLATLDIDDTANAADITFADEKDIPDWLLKKGKIAYEMEIISGVSDDNKSLYLYPNAPITRAEAFVMINNALLVKSNITNSDKDVDYADKDMIPSWATQAIKNLSSYKIIQGSSDKTVNPNGIASRAEGAELCYKLLKQLETTDLPIGSGDLK